MSSIPLPNAPGIYQITCVPTGKIYVGSAVNLRRRWREHVLLATKGAHKSPYFQKAWNKYGAESFTIAVLELCDRNQLIEREQCYLDTLRPYDRSIGFNVAQRAGSTLGRVASAETRAKIGEANRKRTVSETTRQRMREKRPSEETRAKMSIAHIGLTHSDVTKAKMRTYKPTEQTLNKLRALRHSDETRNKISQSKQGKPRSPQVVEGMFKRHANNRHRVIHIASGEICIVHLPTFCKEHNLSYDAMTHTITGRNKQHQGYRVERIPKVNPTS